MYSLLRTLLLRWLNIPTGPPEPPPGGGEVVKIFRASRRFLAYRLIAVFLGGLFAILVELGPLALLLTDRRLSSSIAWAIVIVAGVVTFHVLFVVYFAIRIDYDTRYYVVTDRSLRIREGVWILRESTLTFANVQNIRIQKGPLQQLFGIADVVVETAGGGAKGPEPGAHGLSDQHRGMLRGIDNAEEVRDLVLGLLKRYKDAGLGDPEDERRHARAAAGTGQRDVLREILVEVRALRTTLATDAP